MVYEIGVLKHFAKFTGKKKYGSLLFFHNVARWKISENSQENTAGVSFLIKLQAEKSLKIHKNNHLCRNFVFNKVAGVVGWKIYQNSQGNTCAVVSFLINF